MKGRRITKKKKKKKKKKTRSRRNIGRNRTKTSIKISAKKLIIEEVGRKRVNRESKQ